MAVTVRVRRGGGERTGRGHPNDQRYGGRRSDRNGNISSRYRLPTTCLGVCGFGGAGCDLPRDRVGARIL